MGGTCRAGSQLRYLTRLLECGVSLLLWLSTWRFGIVVRFLVAVNKLLTRLKERRIYFCSLFEGLGHHGGEGRRCRRWLVGHTASAVRKQREIGIGTHLPFSFPSFYFIQDPSSWFDAELAWGFEWVFLFPPLNIYRDALRDSTRGCLGDNSKSLSS